MPSTPAPAPAPLEPPPVVRASSEDAPPSIFGESFDGFIKALAETPVSAARLGQRHSAERLRRRDPLSLRRHPLRPRKLPCRILHYGLAGWLTLWRARLAAKSKKPARRTLTVCAHTRAGANLLTCATPQANTLEEFPLSISASATVQDLMEAVANALGASRDCPLPPPHPAHTSADVPAGDVRLVCDGVELPSEPDRVKVRCVCDPLCCTMAGRKACGRTGTRSGQRDQSEVAQAGQGAADTCAVHRALDGRVLLQTLRRAREKEPAGKIDRDNPLQRFIKLMGTQPPAAAPAAAEQAMDSTPAPPPHYSTLPLAKSGLPATRESVLLAIVDSRA